MSEGIYNVVQFGRQSNIATAVATTTLFPVDAGFLGFQLDRAIESPDEDFGSPSREQTNRGSQGVRWATASLPFVGRFQDVVHAFEMHVAAISGGTPTGTASPYSYAYTFPESYNLLSDAVKMYTVEYGVKGSTQDEWRATGVLADSFEFGFDALSAPGNMMWKGTLGLVGIQRDVHAITSGQSAPGTLETMEGHLTTLAEGPVGTAFGSLSALTASLKQFRMHSSLNAVGRAYGGTSDQASSIGRSGKGDVTFDALVAISSTSKTDIEDIYDVAGGLPTERRWRIGIAGTGVNNLYIDARVRFKTVDLGDHEGEHLYAVNGVWINDSTLSGRGKFTLANAVATIP